MEGVADRQRGLSGRPVTRLMRRGLIVGVLFLGVLLAATEPGIADDLPGGGNVRLGSPNDGGGDGAGLEASLPVSSPGNAQGPLRRGRSGEGGARFYWRSSPSNGAICGTDGNLYIRAPLGGGSEWDANLPPGVTRDPVRSGHDVELWDRQTQLPVPTVPVRTVCSGPDAAVPLPPEPPSAEEIRARIPIPEGRMGISPALDGLTGLETWLWYEGEVQPVELRLDIRGYAVTASAKPVVFTWKMAPDPASQYSRSVPGSKAHPAAVHVYQTKADYMTVMEVSWGGSYSFSGFGIGLTNQPLGRVTLSSERLYHVVEARGVRR